MSSSCLVCFLLLKHLETGECLDTLAITREGMNERSTKYNVDSIEFRLALSKHANWYDYVSALEPQQNASYTFDFVVWVRVAPMYPLSNQSLLAFALYVPACAFLH